jgi:LysM repeat protein
MKLTLKVGEGDTLESLAKRYNISYDKLLIANSGVIPISCLCSTFLLHMG